MAVWPWALLEPSTERWRLRGVAINPGVSTGGTTSTVRTDGGGLWFGEQTFFLESVEKIKAARAIEALLDGGASNIVALSYETPFVGNVGAVTAAAAALRATSLTLTVGGPDALAGGERFSITHTTKGMRRYTIAAIAGGVATIRPPLREAIGAATVLDFHTVGCVCKLANADDFLGALNNTLMMEATAQWVEAF